MVEASPEEYAKAVLHGDTARVRELLRAGAQLNWVVNWKGLALPTIFVAALKQDEVMVSMLLQEGDSLLKVYNYQTPLSYSVLLQLPDSFSFILHRTRKDPSFNMLKAFKDTLQNGEKEMYTELRRYFHRIPSPSQLEIDDLPAFYLKDLHWQKVLLLLFAYKRGKSLHRLPEPLLRDICSY